MSFDDIRATLKRAHDEHFSACCISANIRLSARRKAQAAAKAIQVRHDQHVASHRTSSGAASAKTAHKQRQAAKAALRADPAARAAALEQLNAPIVQKHRMAFLQSLALDLAAEKTSPRANLSLRRPRNWGKSNANLLSGRL